ncbi:GIY-YIG nuclease family protein [Joostella atrarenae]|uniref:GIY-YIG nuclease family protein n=1 Tax=Joostella atrarenae TaxID=679257 RepID=A0ABS9J3B0_9FLAO|nr:GIY-YIG nuclease family protein [Joostella atrarenae]MCF8714903.1 GIY-YIG nuclease family protein [Joostella atrarenae]
MKIYYVYLLECSDDSYYIGMTSNLNKRLYEHNVGIYPSAYTYNRRPLEIKWFAEFTNVNIAIEKEKQLKGWSRRKKKALIEENWDNLVKFSKNYTEYGKDGDGASTSSA